MNKIITTVIDDIPVELEIITSNKLSLNKNDLNKINANGETESTQIKIIKIGSDDKIPTDEQVKNIQSKIDSHFVELIINLLENLSSPNVGKYWWKSKTVWVNIVAIITAIGAMFGLNIPLDPELCMTIFTLIIGLINLFLRKGTDIPLKPIHLNIFQK